MGYKVIFENNRAVRAELVTKRMGMNDFVEFENGAEKPLIKSLYLEAAREKDALKQADRVVYRIWGSELGIAKL